MDVFDGPNAYEVKQLLGEEVQIPAWRLPFNDDYSNLRSHPTIGGTIFINDIRDQYAEAQREYLAEHGDSETTRQHLTLIKQGIDITMRVIDARSYNISTPSGFRVSNPDIALSHFMWVNT